MTGLIGLLLAASPAQRADLAREWAGEADHDAGAQIVSLYRRMTNPLGLGALLDRLSRHEAILLSILARNRTGKLSIRALWRQTPLTEEEVEKAIACLARLGVVYRQRDFLVLPAELAPLLRELLLGPRSSAERESYAPGTSSSQDDPHPEIPNLLVACDAPQSVVSAEVSLVDCVDLALALSHSPFVGGPPGMAEAITSLAAHARHTSQWLSRNGKNSSAAANFAYAFHCAVALGVVAFDSAGWHWGPEAAHWIELGVDAKARALYELWLGDRDYRSLEIAGDRHAARDGINRADRLRQRLCRALRDAKIGVWYSLQSLAGRYNRVYAAATSKRPGAKYGQMVDPARVLTQGFFWFGGLDLGADESGEIVSFRLNALGAQLIAAEPGGPATSAGIQRV